MSEYDPPPLPRNYSDAELRAARTISGHVWNQPFGDKRGPLYYACGDFWPAELLRRAEEADRQSAAMRLVAAAMAREGCVVHSFPPTEADS